MSFPKDLPELLEAGVISEETAEAIRAYYAGKESNSTNRLFVVFGILGAILVGLGIILIIAHNWDDLSIGLKTFFAFLPLLTGQAFCAYALLKKPDSAAWRESSSAFLFFAVGAAISLVSQIYHIPGKMSAFLATWVLVCLPLVYIMRSSVASLLYIVGVTWYAVEVSYWTYRGGTSYLYWALLPLVLPFYYWLFKNKPQSNFTAFHHWLLTISLVITLQSLETDLDVLLFVGYFTLFGLFYLMGNLEVFRTQKFLNNAYKIVGALGTIVMLLMLSFEQVWEHIQRQEFYFPEMILSPEFIGTLLLSLAAIGLFYRQWRKDPALPGNRPMAVIFILFIPAFILGYFTSFSVILINAITLGLGMLTIRNGARADHLGRLNLGLLIIAALVTCRFFDTNLSFVVRGLLFLAVGIGFFVTNYWMLQKRKANA